MLRRNDTANGTTWRCARLLTAALLIAATFTSVTPDHTAALDLELPGFGVVQEGIAAPDGTLALPVTTVDGVPRLGLLTISPTGRSDIAWLSRDIWPIDVDLAHSSTDGWLMVFTNLTEDLDFDTYVARFANDRIDIVDAPQRYADLVWDSSHDPGSLLGNAWLDTVGAIEQVPFDSSNLSFGSATEIARVGGGRTIGDAEALRDGRIIEHTSIAGGSPELLVMLGDGSLVAHPVGLDSASGRLDRVDDEIVYSGAATYLAFDTDGTITRDVALAAHTATVPVHGASTLLAGAHMHLDSFAALDTADTDDGWRRWWTTEPSDGLLTLGTVVAARVSGQVMTVVTDDGHVTTLHPHQYGTETMPFGNRPDGGLLDFSGPDRPALITNSPVPLPFPVYDVVSAGTTGSSVFVSAPGANPRIALNCQWRGGYTFDGPARDRELLDFDTRLDGTFVGLVTASDDSRFGELVIEAGHGSWRAPVPSGSNGTWTEAYTSAGLGASSGMSLVVTHDHETLNGWIVSHHGTTLLGPVELLSLPTTATIEIDIAHEALRHDFIINWTAGTEGGVLVVRDHDLSVVDHERYVDGFTRHTPVVVSDHQRGGFATAVVESGKVVVSSRFVLDNGSDGGADARFSRTGVRAVDLVPDHNRGRYLLATVDDEHLYLEDITNRPGHIDVPFAFALAQMEHELANPTDVAISVDSQGNGVVVISSSVGEEATVISFAVSGAPDGCGWGGTDHSPARIAPNAPLLDVTQPFATVPRIVPTGRPGERSGYWLLDAGGEVTPFGDAPDFGDAVGQGWVDITTLPGGSGYWALDSAGNVTTFGDAIDFGDISNALGIDTTVALAASPTGGGYLIFTSSGIVHGFGDAQVHGDLRGLALDAPIIDAIALPDGTGYWLVAADGGVFTFGAAQFLGSVPQVLPGVTLNAPVVGLVPTADGTGYWLVAADGGVFSFNAPFVGSIPAVLPAGTQLDSPIAGMVSYGNGYLLVGGDGGVFNFSNLPFDGSLGGQGLTGIVAIEPYVFR